MPSLRLGSPNKKIVVAASSIMHYESSSSIKAHCTVQFIGVALPVQVKYHVVKYIMYVCTVLTVR